MYAYKILDDYFWGRIAFEYMKYLKKAYSQHDFHSKLAEIRNAVYESAESDAGNKINDMISHFIRAEGNLLEALENITNLKIDTVTPDNFLRKVALE